MGAVLRKMIFKGGGALSSDLTAGRGWFVHAALLVVFGVFCLHCFYVVDAEGATSCPGQVINAVNFSDTFSGTSIDPEKWNVDLGNGSVSVANDVATFSLTGGLFPVISTKGNPFPVTGNYSLYFKLKYLPAGVWYGAGLSAQSFPYQGRGDQVAPSSWYTLSAWGAPNQYTNYISNGTGGYQSLFGPNHFSSYDYHEFETCIIDNVVIGFIDGVEVGRGPLPADVSGLQALWIGNPQAQLLYNNWVSFEVDTVEVRNFSSQSPGSYNLTATPASYNQINLDWSPISGAAIYALYRAESAAGPFAHRVYCGGDTSHEDKESTLAPSTTYYYKVMSGDATARCESLATGWATPSPAVPATTFAAGPLAPLEISLSSTKGMPGGSVDINGSGFTIGGDAQIKIQRLGDSAVLTENPFIDDYGKIVGTIWDIPSDAVAGSYLLMGVDVTTGRTSAAVAYEVSPANIIQTGNYNFANVDTESNYFAVWADISVNGQKNTQICNEYFYRVTAESGMSVEPQGCLYLGDGTTSNSSRYRFRFKVGSVGRAAWFENGKITLERKADHATHDFSDLHGFSVYGTTFDIKKHAWKFANGYWTLPNEGVGGNDFGKALGIVRSLLPKEKRAEFNASFGSSDGWFSDPDVGGACYGLAATAITDFTHASGSTWVRASLDYFLDDIKAHWPDGASQAAGPGFKPFNSSSTVFEREWDQQSAKQIMYYNAAQDYLGMQGGQSFQGSNGAGEVSNGVPGEYSDMSIILKNGAPILLNFSIDNPNPESVNKTLGHTVAITQMVVWNGSAYHFVWDNNKPYNENSQCGHYMSWLNLNDYDSVFGDLLSPFDIKTGMLSSDCSKSKKSYNFRSVDIVIANELFPEQTFVRRMDPHNFYNVRSEQKSSFVGVAKDKSFADVQPVINNSMSYPEHIDVQLVGAKVNTVKQKGTEQEVSLIQNGEILQGQAVIRTTTAGLFNFLYLPVSSDYRIDITKLAGFEDLNIIAKVTLSDGRVEEIQYENLPLAAADATQAYFYVGRGNSDKELHLVAGGAHAPSYENTFLPTISAPSNFRGLFEAGGVRLSWSQAQHPAFNHVQVLRKVGGFPESLTDGTVVYSGAAEGVVDATAVSNYLYYYSAFSVDGSGNASPPAEFSIDTRRFSIEGTLTQADGQTLEGGKIELLDGDGLVQYETYSGRDGRYTLPNLENNPYSIKAEKFGKQFRNTPRNVDINIANRVENFVADSVPAIRLLFDLPQVYLGGSYDLRWAYANLPAGETVNVRLKRNGVWESIATGVPAINGVLSWKVNGAVSADATVEIVTASNQTVMDTIQLAIENGAIFKKEFPWTMFLPAITGKKR